MKPVLLHVHIYYAKMWEELREKVAYVSEFPFELFVSLTENNSENERLTSDILAVYPKAKIEIVPNKGYDIAPFIHVINQVNLDDYSYIVKLHTKRDLVEHSALINNFLMDGSRWRSYLLSIVSSREVFKQQLDYLENNQACGMLSDFRLIVASSRYDKEASQKLQAFLDESHISIDKFSYVAGTMFIARASLFRALQKFAFSFDDFDEVNTKREGQFAHVLERLLGAIVYAQGFSICDGLHTKGEIAFRTCINAIKNFFFLKYKTKSGKLLIKVFKIPVWSKKIRK